MTEYSLTDNEFQTIEPLITYTPQRGRRPTKIREMFDGILWILCSGAPWRNLPRHYPPYRSVYHRFSYYQKHGILEHAITTLLQKSEVDRGTQLTPHCADGIYARAARQGTGLPDRAREKPPKRRRQNSHPIPSLNASAMN